MSKGFGNREGAGKRSEYFKKIQGVGFRGLSFGFRDKEGGHRSKHQCHVPTRASMSAMQGYLAHEKPRTPSTLQVFCVEEEGVWDLVIFASGQAAAGRPPNRARWWS